MRASSVSVNAAATLPRVLAAMERDGVDELPVTGDDGAFQAMVERHAVERRVYDRGDEDATAAMIGEPAIARATPGEPIEDAVGRMLAADLDVLPVASARGRLEGVLVLEDLRRVPDLVEAVAEDRDQRDVAAGAGVAKVTLACGLASAALGVVLFGFWVEGPAYGLPTWVAWANGIAAALAFIGAVSASAREMISIPLWAIAGFGLIFAASLAHASHRGAWSTWVQLAFGIAFLAMAAILGTAPPRRRRGVTPIAV